MAVGFANERKCLADEAKLLKDEAAAEAKRVVNEAESKVKQFEASVAAKVKEEALRIENEAKHLEEEVKHGLLYKLTHFGQKKTTTVATSSSSGGSDDQSSNHKEEGKNSKTEGKTGDAKASGGTHESIGGENYSNDQQAQNNNYNMSFRNKDPKTIDLSISFGIGFDGVIIVNKDKEQYNNSRAEIERVSEEKGINQFYGSSNYQIELPLDGQKWYIPENAILSDRLEGSNSILGAMMLSS